ncbi:hypothetical protein [Polyangium sp. 15x6]|uniref:hypothetical protein n=1 Tax=Polyangium sp. 15x6 TaxID=3042687 RepID=UPI00249AC3A7|nr:hypothetical protein [Polyangium sp. 15x6]MDI3291519.1 hypothetical protein [Polyangium sp. 15x6]
MFTRKLLLGLGASCVAVALAFAAVEPQGTKAAHAAAPPEVRGPRVAVLATFPGAEHTSLYLVQAGGGADPAPVATFAHLPDAAVRAAVVPGTPYVLATADTTPSRDASFNASLFRLRPHAPPEALVDRVVHASRPLVTSAGRIFVSRGRAGTEIEGRLRVDPLTVDEVDLSTGKTRAVHAEHGHLLFLAGAAGKEIVLYRVLPHHADVVAVDPDTGAVRSIVKNLPPFARDFSIDAGGKKLVFQGRHETDSRTWVVDEIDLASGHARRLFSSPSMTLAPAVLPSGGVLYNPPGRGLSTLDAEARIAGPLGPGVDLVAAATTDSRWIAALHTQPSSLAIPFLVDATTGVASALPAPRGSRVTIAGFYPANGGAL